jgi:hypothetical protein
MARPEITGRKPNTIEGATAGEPKTDDDEEEDDAEDDAGDAAAEAGEKPQRPKRTDAQRRRERKAAAVAASKEAEPDAFSIEEFCLRHRISVGLFYKFPEDMPDSFFAGKRRLISREAAARWRRKREQSAKRELAAAS